MKKALITGASMGIGLAFAKELAKNRYSLTLVARNTERLQSVIKNLSGTNHDFLSLDLSTNEGIESLINHIKNTKYDLLINNAGYGVYGDYLGKELSVYKNMLQLNVNALISFTYAFLENAKKGDALINIGSVIGTSTYSGAAVYAGTKGFVNTFTESLWDEFRRKGIYVCVLSPGVTLTDFHTVAGGKSDDYPKVFAQTPNQVALELMNALQKRSKPHIVSGFNNRMMLFFFRFLSRKMVVLIMGAFKPKSHSS